MKKRLILVGLGCLAAVIAAVALAGTTTVAGALTYGHLNLIQKRILSGFASSEISAQMHAAPAAPTAGLLRASPAVANYSPLGTGDCSQTLTGNVKVNQNCLNLTDPDLQGRAQAQNETSIAQDPSQPTHLVASFNDYRRGDGQCGAAWSVDNGASWNDSAVPMSFTRGQPTFGAARQYWGAGGDTSVAWDTKGNAYLSCQVFNRGQPPTPNPDLSSAFYVFRATQNHGASWNFPGRPVAESADPTGSGAVFLDKQLLTVDNHPGSPFQDRVYVTWTEFAADGSAYIWAAYSSDYGEHFSARHLVSTNSSTLCPNDFRAGTPQGACNENQFSQPFTGRDGALYVAYANFNSQGVKPGEGGNDAPVAGDNRYQMLLTKSTDGGNTFGPPVKVADYYDLPDCLTYQGQDPGRSCVPEKGPTSNSVFRAANYPVGAVNPTNPRQVVVTFGSYINAHSNQANGCVPTDFAASGNPTYDGVKTGACNNDILISVSGDGGATFTGTTTDPRSLPTVNQDPGQARTDQFWQWATFTRTGTLAVAYYDRQYGTDETTGFSDESLSGSRDLARFGTRRVTLSSMPPPTQFGGQFYGDYAGLDAIDVGHPLWADTRNPDLFLCPGTGTPTAAPAVCTGPAPNASIANDEDVFTALSAVPVR